MNIVFNTTKLHPKSDTGFRENGPGSRTLTETVNLHEQNDTMNYKINATARDKSRGRTSFKGSGVNSTIIKEAPKWVDKFGATIANTPKLQNAFQSISGNILMAEATFALLLTAIARPATILATPTKDPENKQKNKYAATKSVATGLVGFIATFIVSQPFKKAATKAIEKLKEANEIFEQDQIKTLAKYLVDVRNKVENPIKEYIHTFTDDELAKIAKSLDITDLKSEAFKALPKAEKRILPDTIIKKAQELFNEVDFEKHISKIKIEGSKKLKKGIIKEFGEEQLAEELLAKVKSVLKGYESTTNNFMNKSNGPIFWPLKAMVTVALVPIILSALGIKKNSAKKADPQEDKNKSIQAVYNAELTPPQKTNSVFQSFAGVTNNENK